MTEVLLQPEGRPVIMTAGTSILRAVARTQRGNWQDLLRAAAGGQRTDDQLNGGFRGVLEGPEQSPDFVGAVQDYLAQTHEDSRWREVIELRALKAVTAKSSPTQLVFLGANTLPSRMAAYALNQTLLSEPWTTSWDWYDLGLETNLADARQSLGQLHRAFGTVESGRAEAPLAVIAGGFNAMVAVVTLFAFMADVELVEVVGIDGDASLLSLVRSEAAGVLASVPSAEDVAGAAARGLAELRHLPHEVRRFGHDGPPLASDEARERMKARTHRWNNGDVWQADRLPQIVHHGAEHGRRVDTLSNEILRRSSFLDQLSAKERDTAVEALSAASWLHDVGQRGGALGQHYVTDSEHVRLYHGLLTRRVIEEYGGEFELGMKSALDPSGDVGWLTGELCARHQRLLRLDTETQRAFKGCSAYHDASKCYDCALDNPHDVPACALCSEIRVKVEGDSLRQAMEIHRERGGGEVLPVETAVRLAAILRVADAADIGVHRVNGRWQAGTRHSIEDIWRSDFARDLHLQAQVRGLSATTISAIDLLVIDGSWPANLHTNCVDRLRSESDGMDLARRLKTYGDFLSSQMKYVKKHQPFAGATLVNFGSGSNSFGFRLIPSPTWSGLDQTMRESWFDEAADYIWTEYLDAESFFANANSGLPSLTNVLGPDHFHWDRPRADAAAKARAVAEAEADAKAKAAAEERAGTRTSMRSGARP